MRTRTVEYHSVEWGDLVEHGWVTMSVEGTRAWMLFDGRKR